MPWPAGSPVSSRAGSGACGSEASGASAACSVTALAASAACSATARSSARRPPSSAGPALDVDAPAHELGRQADVLALFADGEAELLVLDHDLHDPLLLVEDRHAADLGRAERVDHEGGGVVVPLDDVDLLAPQLADDR